MLARYSALDASLRDGAERSLHTEDVETFLEVLFAEADEAGRIAYEQQIDQADAEAYPWTAVRARAINPGDLALDVALTFAPPALVLALTRREDLEPELPGDELPGALPLAVAAIERWDPAALLDSISPFGWSEPDLAARGTLDDVDAMAAIVANTPGDTGA
ncbi:MAG: hypothetical protein H6713_05770 [Myxococcales bacterium]|nr:hypothetical protein [Myxococcales bacterium]